MALAIPAPAKLNLGLKVLARREDGQHEIRTTYQAISLHDLVQVEPAASTELSVDGLAGAPVAENLVLRAAAALEAAAGRKLPARWRLTKRIPAGAGLGGGSSDAAAALVGLARIYDVGVDLADLAAELGADVPFFLNGGAAIGEGRGERLRALPAASAWFAIAWPGFQVSTAAVYRAWDDLGGEGENELERAALSVEPQLARFAARLGPGWRMTGSGSAFFRPAADCRSAEEARAGVEGWTAVAHTLGAWG